jgi:orotidine-5'-phosphate decarboxylase
MSKTENEINQEVREKLFLRLEFSDLLNTMNPDPARNMLRKLSQYFGYFLIDSLQTTKTSFGPDKIIKFINSLGGKAFIDGKYIGSAESINKIGQRMSELKAAAFSVHAINGVEKMKAAVKGVKNGKTLVFAETIFGSQKNDYSEHDSIFSLPVTTNINKLAQLARGAGVDGIMFPAEYSTLFFNNKGGYEKIIRLAMGATTPWSKIKTNQDRTNFIRCLQSGASAVILGQDIFFPPKEIGGPENAAKKVFNTVKELYFK